MSEEKCKFYNSHSELAQGQLVQPSCKLALVGDKDYYWDCDDNPNCYFKQLQTAKEENEKLKGRNEHLEKVHEVDTHFCTAFINLKEGLSKILHHYYFTRGKYNLESMCLIPAIQTLVGRLRGKVDKQEKEIELLTQQNKQMREALENVKFEAEFNGNDESLQKIINIVNNTIKGGE